MREASKSRHRSEPSSRSSSSAARPEETRARLVSRCEELSTDPVSAAGQVRGRRRAAGGDGRAGLRRGRGDRPALAPHGSARCLRLDAARGTRRAPPAGRGPRRRHALGSPCCTGTQHGASCGRRSQVPGGPSRDRAAVIPPRARPSAPGMVRPAGSGRAHLRRREGGGTARHHVRPQVARGPGQGGCPKASASTTYGTRAKRSRPTPVPSSRTSWSGPASPPSARN